MPNLVPGNCHDADFYPQNVSQRRLAPQHFGGWKIASFIVTFGPGAHPGFWFESRIGTWSGDESTVTGSTGRAQVGFRGEAPRCPKSVTSWGWKNHLRKEKKTNSYRLTLYDDIIIIIISCTRRNMFPAIFVLYKTQSAGCRASEMVHNGSRAQSSSSSYIYDAPITKRT